MSSPGAATHSTFRTNPSSAQDLASIVAKKVALSIQAQLLRVEVRLDELIGRSRLGQNEVPNLDLARVDSAQILARQVSAETMQRTITMDTIATDSKTVEFSPHEAFLADIEDESSEEEPKLDVTSRLLNTFKTCGSRPAEPMSDGWLAQVVQSNCFSYMSFMAIVLNTAFIWYVVNYTSADLEHRLRAPDDFLHILNVTLWNTTSEDGHHNIPVFVPFQFHVIEFGFVVFYTIEFGMRCCVYRWNFFFEEEWCWNIFDVILVLTGWVDVVLRFSTGCLHLYNNTSLMRIMRLSRILRILKAFRFLTELRMMAGRILGNIQALLWICIFMSVSLMVSALYLVENMTAYRHDECDRDPGKPCQKMQKMFGNVHRGMLTLFECCTGGISWYEVYDLVHESGVLPAWYLVAHIVFFTMALLNVVTSMFVQKALVEHRPDMDDLVRERRKRDAEMTRQLQELFQCLDAGDAGIISIEELKHASHKEEMQVKFEMLGITLRDVQTFFYTLSAMAPGGLLTEDTFVEAWLKLSGPASSLDVQSIRCQMQDLWRYRNFAPPK